ncbi:GNAT family N-acetyltransferase [Streptomyces rectiverticillatus]|uniref:GNAT family N-acetyltransferase n=1 Tax=Streptomyces rectiverticillatus TaxID=173860 RepID=UPI0015C366D6|nr:GNAT family N-acetyltransferase [Streptomyces rectiverticillatus]QLE75278.1 GNAT family N-acetyltransferase [Streptomyces rectiverticillatus]
MLVERLHGAALPAGPRPPWFPAGRPGLGALPEHVALTGHGSWWADDPSGPRAVAVSCAGHAILAGDPRSTDPGDLRFLAGHYVAAPDRFLPVLGAAFHRVVPWERMIRVRRDPSPVVRLGPEISVRRLLPRDARALRTLGPDMAWLSAGWGGPAGLAASGRCWGAFCDGALLSLACSFFVGSRYEDIAVATLPEERGRGLASVCVQALCKDVTARGRIPSWTCSRDNHPSRRLAAKTGFQLVHEFVHYAVGLPAARPPAGDSRILKDV